MEFTNSTYSLNSTNDIIALFSVSSFAGYKPRSQAPMHMHASLGMRLNKVSSIRQAHSLEDTAILVGRSAQPEGAALLRGRMMY